MTSVTFSWRHVSIACRIQIGLRMGNREEHMAWRSSSISRIKQTHRCYFSSKISKDETEKFARFSDRWWDETGDMKALHSLNKLRVPFIRDCLILEGFGKTGSHKPLTGVDILEVGCGAGVLSEPLARLGASVVGIDAADQALNVASVHRGNDSELSDLQYVDAHLEDIVAVGSLRFDCVIASEVIEHVMNRKEFVQMCTAVLRPGGSLFISTISRTAVSFVAAVALAERVFGIVPKGTHDWNKFVNPDELSAWMTEGNCRVRKVHGMAYFPVFDRWFWCNPTDINYIVHATKDV